MDYKGKKGFTLVEIMIVVVIVGLLAAMAAQTFQQIRATSQKKAITNNLRQYASAAQQYILENGVTTATYANLVGVGEYISSLETIAGEDYTSLTVTDTQTQITVTKTDGTPITYDF